jgi:hypothetical protein
VGNSPAGGTRLSRRAALAMGLTATGAALAPPMIGAAEARLANPRRFLSAAQLNAWQRALDGMGLRATASSAHERYIDLLHERLARAGIHRLWFERVPIRRWTPQRWSVELFSGSDATRLPVVSYIPYSGLTGSGGISGRLAVLEEGATPAPGSLAGAVVLFRLAPEVIPNPALETIAYKVYDPQHVLSDDGIYQRWQPGRTRLVLDQLEDSGAAAAVGILDLPPDAAVSGYYPYDGVLRSVPGVYVDRATGERLKAAARDGRSARVTLTAKVERTASRNLLGLIPGASRELMVLNSHTDGPNAIEDNGPNAIVAMSRHLARQPRRSLPRTILISLTTGHFYGGAGQVAFLARHRHDLVPRTAAALTVEHLGALQWRVSAERSALTGHQEPGLFFAPEVGVLVDAAYAAAAQAKAAPTLISRPITEAPRARDGRGFPAEGSRLWTDGGIPTANFIAGPMYLFNFGHSTMDKFSAPLMRAQAIAFTRMLLKLSRVPRRRLRRLDLLSGGR